MRPTTDICGPEDMNASCATSCNYKPRSLKTLPLRSISLSTRRNVHPQAYEACLKGIFFRDKMTPADLTKSTTYFIQAIELDPAYAHAYANLSQAYFYIGLFGIRP